MGEGSQAPPPSSAGCDLCPATANVECVCDVSVPTVQLSISSWGRGHREGNHQTPPSPSAPPPLRGVSVCLRLAVLGLPKTPFPAPAHLQSFLGGAAGLRGAWQVPREEGAVCAKP